TAPPPRTQALPPVIEKLRAVLVRLAGPGSRPDLRQAVDFPANLPASRRPVLAARSSARDREHVGYERTSGR
ncbi:MAG: hypothetical protein QME96_13915, partial [Myxococcota bacterium]|nr:hypothetical protein [Myxococcota bacterium]